tara:strand:+ start:132733 stop:133218 length:486 start_codon:yes stop_codon:yes gene_type:complete
MSILRKTITSSVAVLCLAVASPALAQEVGNFKSTFTKVVDNCDKGLDLTKASLTISKTEGSVTVRIDALPPLVGKAGKRGKLRAEAKGKGHGMDVRYGLNGRVSDGELQAVFVAEYFKGKTPVCTQSFRVVGTAAQAAAPSKGAKTASSSMAYGRLGLLAL